MIEKKVPELVMLNLDLKGGGFNAVKVIREYNDEIIIMVISNYNFEQYKQKSIDLGADYFIYLNNEFDKIPQLLEQIRYK